MGMAMTKQEIKEELRSISDKIRMKVDEIFGDQARDFDFSYIDLFTVLYFYAMHHEPDNPTSKERDRLLISNIKVVPSLLAVLARIGYLNWREFHELVMVLPKLFSNPHMTLVNYPGVEFITNSLYLGTTQSLGSALVGLRSRQKFNVYHVLTEKCTPSLQEALLTASSCKMNNLISIIPFLDIQQRSNCIHFWFSMGWQLEETRFDDINRIFEGFARASRSREKPRVFLG